MGCGPHISTVCLVSYMGHTMSAEQARSVPMVTKTSFQFILANAMLELSDNHGLGIKTVKKTTDSLKSILTISPSSSLRSLSRSPLPLSCTQSLGCWVWCGRLELTQHFSCLESFSLSRGKASGAPAPAPAPACCGGTAG